MPLQSMSAHTLCKSMSHLVQKLCKSMSHLVQKDVAPRAKDVAPRAKDAVPRAELFPMGERTGFSGSAI